MLNHLFENFLKDPEEYKKAEAYWQERWRHLIERAGEQHLWKTQWLNTTFSDGTKFLDGNPIFSAVCPSRRLGIRVIQQEQRGNAPDFHFWTDTFGDTQQDTIRELVISCVLTPETLNEALDLMRQWITDEEIHISEMRRQAMSDDARPPSENRSAG
jgi:hypothetical protein